MNDAIESHKRILKLIKTAPLADDPSFSGEHFAKECLEHLDDPTFRPETDLSKLLENMVHALDAIIARADILAPSQLVDKIQKGKIGLSRLQLLIEGCEQDAREYNSVQRMALLNMVDTVCRTHEIIEEAHDILTSMDDEPSALKNQLEIVLEQTKSFIQEHRVHNEGMRALFNRIQSELEVFTAPNAFAERHNDADYKAYLDEHHPDIARQDAEIARKFGGVVGGLILIGALLLLGNKMRQPAQAPVAPGNQPPAAKAPEDGKPVKPKDKILQHGPKIPGADDEQKNVRQR